MPSAAAAATAMPTTTAGRSSKTLARAKPTLTSPTGEPPATGFTGTFARADSPSVPVSHSTTSSPASASAKLVLTTSPSRVRIGMRQTDAVIVGDDDEQRVRPLHDRCRETLQLAVAQGRGIRSPRVGRVLGDQPADVIVLGDRPRDVERGCPRLGAQLLDGEEGEHRGADRDDRDDGRELKDENPGREPHGASSPS